MTENRDTFEAFVDELRAMKAGKRGMIGSIRKRAKLADVQIGNYRAMAIQFGFKLANVGPHGESVIKKTHGG